MRISRGTIRAAVALLMLLALFLVGMQVFQRWEEGGRSGFSDHDWMEQEEDGGALLNYQGNWYAPRNDVESVLMLGLDRSEAEDISVSGDYAQSDFIMLLQIDRAAERCTPILLNRDTMAEIQDYDEYGRPSGTYQAQLALAYAHAQAYTRNEKTAGRAAMDAVSKLLYGVKIDHYVTLTMDGIIVLNDLAGGVTVEIRDDFSAVDPTLVQGERVTLLGEHALKYVRSRWQVGDSTNLERMERQEEYLNALQERLAAMSDGDEEFILSSLLKINEHMDSDCTVEQLSRLAEDIRSLQMEDFITLAGEAVMGETYIEFIVDEDALQKLVVDYFYAPAEAG